MQCADVRAFMSQIAGKSVSTQISQSDVDFLCSGGYLSVMQKDQYDKALAEVADLTQLNDQQQGELNYERGQEATLKDEEHKTHSIIFHFENKEKRETELDAYQKEKDIVSQVEAEVAQRDLQIKQLIEKKSIVDKMTPYNGFYLSLTGLGVLTLNDLNVKNYRVSASQFSDYVDEDKETTGELQAIAQKGSYHVSNLKPKFSGCEDPSELWNVAIGLSKLQGDPNKIGETFIATSDLLEHFGSTLDNKLMAAEILTSLGIAAAQSQANPDLQSLTDTLKNLEHTVKHDAKVPGEISAGVAALLLFGKRFDGTYPTDAFRQFTSVTRSYESAAILSLKNVPTDQLTDKFLSYRALFNDWGFEQSEDTELASAYLSVSDLGPNDVKDKLNIVMGGLRNYLEYPLVASAILAAIPTLEANETLSLMEKAYSILAPYAPGLESSELVSLSVRMIHGIKNETVKELDPTAKITKAPVQFTYLPSNALFLYRAPIIVAHSYYYATFSSISGFHPAHVHGVGGFMG